MTSRTKTLITVVIALAVVGVFIVASSASKPKTAESVRHDAWTVFQEYLAAAKRHDLGTLTRHSYQLSPQCTDPRLKNQCPVLMDDVYKFFSPFTEQDFSTVWWDDKQIILSTDARVSTTSGAEWVTRSFLYFAVKGGDIKVLYGNPAKTWYIDTTIPGNQEKIQAALTDSDQDGVEDGREMCTTIKIDCTYTDPHKRDTNDDGWWDGIEIYFNSYQPPAHATSTPATASTTKPAASGK